MLSPLLGFSEATNTFIFFLVCISKWNLSNINKVPSAECRKRLSLWLTGLNEDFPSLGELLHDVFSSLVIPGLMNELTNERGFACLGLSLRGRLISIQYAKLLRTQDFIQAPVFWQPTLRCPATPWPILNPSGSCGQYLKIDSPLQSNKLLNPLAGRLRLTLHFDYNQLLSPVADLILWFRPNVKLLVCAGSNSRITKWRFVEVSV